MTRINQYLLTHHPLLWNTRIVWVLLANLVVHGLFFLGGYGSIDALTLSEHSSPDNVGGGSMVSFSILCSLLVLIVWLIYLLRSNAFKLHYRIDRWHLTKEFLLLLLVVFTSISYFQSYNAGVRTHARSITTEAAYARESRIVNQAMAFVPTSEEDYFKLASCAERRRREVGPDGAYTNESVPSPRDRTDTQVLAALTTADSFSYRHYCDLEIYEYGKMLVTERESLSRIRLDWMEGGRKDSVRQVLRELLPILEKYGATYQLPIDTLANWVFATPQNNLVQLVNRGKIYTRDESDAMDYRPNPYFIEIEKVVDALGFVRRARSENERNGGEENLVIGFVALSLTILLWGYRRFSRKVFLISVVGTLVWAIIIGLVVAGSSGDEKGFAGFCLLLFAIFLFAGLAGLSARTGKTMTGIVLTWHAYLAPYVLLLVNLFFRSAYQEITRHMSGVQEQEYMQQQHPFLYWTYTHGFEIALAGFIAALLYLAGPMNRWARRWMEMAEE